MQFRLLAAALLATLTATAQTLPILSQNPTSLRWYRVETPHFKVLYPEGFEQPAKRTAQRLEQVYEPVSAGLDRRPRPLSVILQNQTSVSNGFATLYPRRAEFFTAPPQDPSLLGTLNWLDLLAVHEYRHIVQYEKALQGYGRILYTLLGAQGLGFPSQIVTPGWFLEGDAVGTETILTQSGRGRLPAFELAMRTNLLTRKPFSYAKAVGGSFRDNVPNHYELGYFLTTKLKRTYGPDAWSKSLNRIYTQFPFYPFSFSNGLKQTTKSAENPKGTRVDDLYNEAVADLVETWRKKRESLTVTPATLYPVLAEKANTPRPVFTNYRNPQYLTDSTILCTKSGLGDIPQLVLLSRNGVEKRVYTQGLILENPDLLSATPQTACWIENRYDPRWGQQLFAEIRVLDLASGKLTRLTHRSRYKTVSISPDNSKLIAVRNDTDYQNHLVVLDTKTGRELTVLPNPANDMYIHPRWFNNEAVVTVTLTKEGKTIELIDTRNGQKRALLPVSNSNLSHPQPYTNAFILFNSSQSGIDNIYGVDVASGQVVQVTSRPFGAYHAAVSAGSARGQWIAFQDFDTHGFRIAEMPLDPATWLPVPKPGAVPDQTTRYFGPLLNAGTQTIAPIATDSVAPSPVSAPERYRRLAHPLNIYSWGPTFSSNGQALNVGIQSQDLLATTQITAAYTYNQSEQVGGFAANLSYQGLYPVLDVGFQTGNRRTSYYLDRFNPLDSLRTDTWRYNQISAGVRLPFQLSQSRFNQSANLSAYYGFLQVSGYELPGRLFTETGNGYLHTMTYGANYALTLRQNRRDVGPRLGVAVSTQVRSTPFAKAGELTGLQWGSSMNVFLPGIGKHHYITLRGAYQYQWGTPDANKLYRFQASVLYPRGAAYIPFDNLAVFGGDYRLPLADMHLSITRLLYIQRIKGGVFSDYARGNSNQVQYDSRGVPRAVVPFSTYDWTVGADLSVVFNPLRLRTPLELGLRTIYSIRTGQYLLQPLVLDIGF
ncbi:MAG: hypothetical protein EOO39_01300 [Cytophagaceae bacterium]|nr:MAG: hypothetical protein EOO39_01300 [Cytophagaceae bacterium]